MKRFKYHILVGSVFVFLFTTGTIMNSRQAVAQILDPNGAPVTIQNTSANPVPITGSVGITGTPTVSLAPGASVQLAPGATVGVNNTNSMPLLVSDVTDTLRTPVGARCIANVIDGKCTLYTVPAGNRLIIQSIAVSVVRINVGIDPSETSFLTTTNHLAFGMHLPLLRQASDSFGDYLTGQAPVRIYADSNASVSCGLLFDGPNSPTQGVLQCELSGQLVTLP
jgi:hypothetical protein